MSTTPCLIFRAATHWYAIPAARVVSISASARPVRVPGTPPFVRGVIASGGKVVPVITLSLLLGESSRSGEVARLVLVQDAGRMTACEVAEVLGIEEVSDQVGAATDVPAASGGAHHVGGRLVTRLEVDRLMDLVSSAVRRSA
ncbi:MAG TPA: chemotaxis protein CheW [Myxococcaceae bacterium]|nr:chemotaxis protein CheW [Myxococcaceae bacterium]